MHGAVSWFGIKLLKADHNLLHTSPTVPWLHVGVLGQPCTSIPLLPSCSYTLLPLALMLCLPCFLLLFLC
jgi:hypothetical protein